MSVATLKKELKEYGLSQQGEKGDLQHRIALYKQGEDNMLDGCNPCKLKAGELKKALAKRGLPCDLSIESRDQLNARLIDALKKEKGESGGSGAKADPSSEEDDLALACNVARQALELGEAGDYEAVLSLSGPSITRTTPFPALRKAYLTLARLIHPDKLSHSYEGATRAFQELVRAFETISAPEPTPESVAGAGGGKRKAAAPTIARSNDGCYRTRLFCPRCGDEWGKADSGLDKYEYTLMMQGIKTFCCAGCLCEFGCVTAMHRCPLCSGAFEYHPADYHRLVSCGNKRCGSLTFGFWLYTVPPRVQAQR